MKLLKRLCAVTLCVCGVLVSTAQEAPEQPAAAEAPEQPAVAPAPAAEPAPTAAPRPAGAARTGAAPALTGARTIVPRGGAAARPATGATADKTATGEAALPALKFEQSPVEMVLAAYAEVTGRTLLIAPDVPKVAVTLRSNPQTELTKERYLEAIERILNMNGIVLIPIGETFLRVENSKTVMKRGFETGFTEAPESGHDPKGQFISQMVQLKHLPVDEARKAIEGFKRDDGQLQLFERTNSILILDSAENVNRMLEIIKFIDQPLMVREEVNVRMIQFAKAADIKKRLEDIVAESKKETQGKESTQTKTSGAPGIEVRRPPVVLPPGVTRSSRTATPEASTPNEVIETLVSDAERGMIRGRVNIVADERSNQLIIITSTENMMFFDKLITVLDVAIVKGRDIDVDVIRLEHADAEEVAKMINDLIGKTAKAEDAAKAPAATAGDAKTQTLAEAVEARRTTRTEPASTESTGASSVGQIDKENTTVLADKRINGIIIMGRRDDRETIKRVIASMDVMLSQVLIETVVLEVGLGDGLEAGIDWVKKVSDSQAPGWVVAGGGKTAAEAAYDGLVNVASNAAANLVQNGIAYFTKVDSLNLALVMKASANDSRSKVLASPVIQTMDNKEATIKATDLIYLFNGKKAVNIGNEYTYEDDYVQKEIGITVTVTPRINAKGNVVMTVKQIFQDRGSDQVMADGSRYATTTTREINADVIVDSGQSIILGGLVKKGQTSSKSGIPFLSTIPYIGWIFGYTSNSDTRSELLVFLTPYVFSNQEEASAEARRRREALGEAADGLWTKDWSGSPLAESEPTGDILRRERTRFNREAEDMKAQAALEKLRLQQQKKRRTEAVSGERITESLKVEPLLAPEK